MAVEILPRQFRICQEVNGQFCTISTPFQPLANSLSCIAALYAKNPTSISTRCSLQIRKTSDVHMPSQPTTNVWILTTAPSAVTNRITLICLGETTQFIFIYYIYPQPAVLHDQLFIYPHIMKIHPWK